MTPAETIRRAATLMRERAEQAAEADAAYIASVHPGLMRLVADWLDSVAERWPEAGRRWEGTHALAIARAYLGEQDGGHR